jgi:hypothetical protein
VTRVTTVVPSFLYNKIVKKATEKESTEASKAREHTPNQFHFLRRTPT